MICKFKLDMSKCSILSNILTNVVLVKIDMEFDAIERDLRSNVHLVL